MKFASTRGDRRPVSFADAVLQGLAPDGGLYHPLSEPDLRSLIASFDAGTPFATIAAGVIHALFGDEFSAEEAGALAARAFPFAPELRRLDDHLTLLELFHGPSCAFKDFGAAFLAATMERYLTRRNARAVILTATSGDTGSAVAHAFHRKKNIEVVILYPAGRVSPLQEQQLTTLGDNITAFEVRGSFDDCQRMVKESFVDRELGAAVPLSSANSINIGRLIPQALYYLYAYAQLRAELEAGRARDAAPIFAVPSGNFGNLTAGVLAWRWGLPVSQFWAVTNANDVVPEYLRTGTFTARPSVHTLANAMDVGNPSNFERLERVFADCGLPMNSMLQGFSVNDAQIGQEMRVRYTENGILVCPHTATGLYAARRLRGDAASAGEVGGEAAASPRARGHVITLATAHAAKFSEVCLAEVGVQPEIPERLARLMVLPKRAILIEPDAAQLKRELLVRFAGGDGQVV